MNAMKTYIVTAENVYHMYKLGTVVKPKFPWPHVTGSFAWYVDEAGVEQLLSRDEIVEEE
jgi:hypothetical protein